MRDELTKEELDAVSKVASSKFLADYNKLDKFYTERDLRNETEKKMGFTGAFLFRHVSPSMEYAEKFISDVNAENERLANAVEWDDRQKRALLSQFAQEKAGEYINKIDETMADYKQTVQEVKDYLNEITNALERMTPVEMREYEFAQRDLEAEARTALMTAFTPEQVMAVFSKAKDQARFNKTKARFLVKNSYLYMERINQLSDSHMAKQKTIEIMSGARELELYAYGPEQRGLKKMLNNTSKFNRHGQEGIRLIKKHLKRYK
jgi:DNA-dependent RNA polymerase auxiliary subunit epsilon